MLRTMLIPRLRCALDAFGRASTALATVRRGAAAMQAPSGKGLLLSAYSRAARWPHARELNEFPRRRRLCDRHLDDDRARLLQGATQANAQFGRRLGAEPHRAKALGEADEIG